MKGKYIQYDKITGEILAIVTMSEEQFNSLRPQTDLNPLHMEISGSPADEVFDIPETYYVGLGSPNNLEEKTALGISQDVDEIQADGVDESSFTNIPSGTNVHIASLNSSDTFPITDGQLDFSAITPGEYHIKFTKDLQHTIEEFKVKAI